MDNQDPPSNNNNNNTPSADKGKGRDDGTGSHQDRSTGAAATASTQEAAQSSSVFTRIARSAAGLGRDALAGRPTGSDLGSLAANSGKAGQSGLPAPSGPASQLQPGESSSFRQTATGPGAAGGLASRSHASQHISAQEEEFAQFLDAAPDLTLPSEPLPGAEFESAFASAGHIQSQRYAATGSTSAALGQDTTPLEHAQSSAVTEQERLDGLDVVNLLASGPEEEPNYGDIELAEDEIEALRSALFGTGTAADRSRPSPQEWDNVLNFIPDFVRPNPEGYEEEGTTGAPLSSKTHESRAALGVGHTSETTQLWLNQWHDVLTRYDDEVWGGLSHLVAQARVEVDELKKEPPDERPSDTKALDRLRQILGHLRG